MDQHDDGGFTVLVPTAPTPSLGVLYYAPRERVRLLDVPLGTAVSSVMHWAIDSKALFQNVAPLESATR